MDTTELPAPEQPSEPNSVNFLPDGEYNNAPYPLFTEADQPFDVSFSARAARELLARNEDLRSKHNQDQVIKERLEKDYGIDPLTGLLNRRGFADAYHKLSFSTATNRRTDTPPTSRQPHSFAVIDIDDFKTFNTMGGHPFGDQVLITIASVFKEMIRVNSDFIGRIGGDELAVIMPHTQTVDASKLIDRIRTVLGEIKQIEGKDVHLGVSVGLTEAGLDYGLTYKNADLAEQMAKEHGKNRTETYDQSMELSGLATKT